MVRQHRFLYSAGILTFALLISSGCTSNDHPNTDDVGNSDKQDVSYDVNEVSDIDESSDTFHEPKDTELIEDVKNDSGSDAEDDVDAANGADIDEEYEQKFQYIEKYYATRMPGILAQYKQWLIVQPTFNFMIPDEYWIDVLVYGKDSPYQLSNFLSDPDHRFRSGGANPIVHENYLFVVGLTGTILPEDGMVPVMSIRVYDLDLLPGDSFLQEIYLNNPVAGLESIGFDCSGPLEFESQMSFALIRGAAFVSCKGRLIEYSLLRDENGRFYNGDNKLVYEGNRTPHLFEMADKKIYLMLESERDIYELNQDGMPTKILSLQLPQYEARGELIQPRIAVNYNKKPEWIGNNLWIPTSGGPFAAVFDMTNPLQPQFLHYTHTWGTLVALSANESYVFALIRATSYQECKEELFDEHCIQSNFDVMVYNRDSPSPVSSLSNIIELDTDGDGFDNYRDIGDIVFDDPMLYLTQTHYYDQDESTQRGILKIDLRERLSELPF